MNINRSWITLLAGAALLFAGCADDSAAQPTATTDATTVDSYGPRHDTGATASSADDAASGRRSRPHRSDRPDGRPDGHANGRSDAPADTAVDTAVDNAADTASDSSAPTVELTQDEIDGLLWMREEEQLAHDVYVALGDKWGLRIFDNISSSETSHVERVVGLLDRYGIDDPMADQPAGTFTVPEMQQWYDELVADGRESLVDALEVGALIEEMDIADLRDRATDNADIATVYDLLERGSHNHLRAFTRQLDARDVTHEPTVLDAAAYDEIVSGASACRVIVPTPGHSYDGHHAP